MRGDLSPKKLEVAMAPAGGIIAMDLLADFTPVVGTEYDVAWDRSGSTVRAYVDGAWIGSGTLAGSLHNTSATLKIGAINFTSSPTNFHYGSMKAWRFTNGVARYATDTTYTVPSLPLPTS
jgi:hypothetical protein